MMSGSAFVDTRAYPGQFMADPAAQLRKRRSTSVKNKMA
jgi:hypothetical protein